MSRRWEGSGPEFSLDWGGQTWILNVAGTNPGLRVEGSPLGPLLSLDGLASPGRWDVNALSGATLASFERHFERIEATYTPRDWSELTVRAAWSPSKDDGVDLEIQISALSVDELRKIEVKLLSRLPEPGTTTRPRRFVEPRDARAAGLSYDGREFDLRGLTTLPIPDDATSLAPRVLPAGDGQTYVEMVHPQDAARRITEAGGPARLGHTTRYGLFGYDLEKGVVLRARLRSYWTPSQTAAPEALERFEKFLREPLPLGS